MKKLICVLLLLAGCSESAELIAMRVAFETASETVTVKQDESLTILRENTTALAAIKSQVESLNGGILETRRALGTMEAKLVVPEPAVKEVIKSALEPQETERDSQTTPLISDSPPAVRLFVTQANFPCAPCERMRRAIEAGEFAEFEIVESAPFDGQQGYPATRFRSRTSPTGWRVVYGFDDSTIAQIRANIDGLARSEVMTGPLTGAFFQYPKGSAILGERSAFRSDNRANRRSRRPINSAFSWLIPATSNQW